MAYASEREALEGFLDSQRKMLIRTLDGLDERYDADMDVNDGDTVDYWVGYYREQIEESRAIVASTARHGGHADIIRETLDGIRQS
ncbi:hypothetical protein ACQPZJ_22015 [Actinoplanes sp. CA-054009]